MNTQRTALLAISASVLVLAGCQGKPPAATQAPAAPAPAAAPAVAASPAALPQSEAPANARAFIISPANGATLKSPVLVEFGIEGMTVAPAGTAEAATGHHHLLVDTTLPALDQPIPNDANHLHFGKGQTSVELELQPGNHTLQLLLGDGNHVPHSPPVMSDTITITVE